MLGVEIMNDVLKKEKPTTAATEVGKLKRKITYFTSHFKRNYKSRQVLCIVCGFHPSTEYNDRFKVWRARSLRPHCTDSAS